MSTPAKSKIIACLSSDPGGAQVVSAATTLLCEQLGLEARFATDAVGFRVQNRTYTVLPDSNQVEAWLKALAPNLLLTGTSTRSSLELSGVRAAKKLGIPTLSLIDHWTGIRARFERAGELTLPDRIGVIDETALHSAISEGIPSEKLVIAGQPHWEQAQNYQPKYSRAEFLSQWKLPEHRPFLVFLSDCLLEEAQGDAQAARKHWGYLETEIAEQVCSVLPMHASLVIQLHPKENLGKYALLRKEQPEVFELKSPDVFELIYHSSGCIGMFTAVLAQAHAMGKPVCRLETAGAADQLPIAAIPRFFDKAAVGREIKTWLTAGSVNQGSHAPPNKGTALIDAVQALL